MKNSMTMPAYTQTKEADSNVTITSSFESTDVTRMSVDVEGSAHIMSLLTDLYSNPNLAVLREYTSNALDSHIEAGQTKPVEVSLPGSLNPVFVVKDFGVGMSADDIRFIYSSYGRSTKRKDFSQIGAFGLGCKSALTLTSQFTLTAVKNGMKTVALISRGADGVGETTILSEKPTSDGNGVTVSIPIPNVSAFLSNTDDLFLGWPTGSVLVDGNEPHTIYSDTHYMHSSDNLLHVYRARTNDSPPGGFFVNLGGIVYWVNLNSIKKETYYSTRTLADTFISRMGNLRMFADIPIGAVDLTPSREALRYSERTKTFLYDLFENSIKITTGLAVDDIANAPTRKDAIDRLITWKRVLGDGQRFTGGFDYTKVLWKGKVIPVKIDIEHTIISTYRNRSYNTTVQQQAATDVPVVNFGYRNTDNLLEYTVLETADADKIRRDYKGYMMQSAKNLDNGVMRVFDTKPTDPWITDRYTYVRESEILDKAKKYRAEQRANATPKVASAPTVFTYHAFKMVKETDTNAVTNGVAYKMYYDEIATTDIKDGAIYIAEDENHTVDLAYRRGSRMDRNKLGQLMDDMGLLDTTIIYIKNTRKVDAFLKRINAKVVLFNTKFSEYRKNLLNTIDDEAKVIIDLSQDYRYDQRIKSIAEFASADIPDTDLVSLATRVKKVLDKDAPRLVRWASHADLSSVDTKHAFRQRIERLANLYPLINFDDPAKTKKYMAHCVSYISTIYQEVTP